MARPVSWAYSEIAANDPRTGQDRARPEQQDRQHTVAYPAGLPRVGNLAQRFNRRQHRYWDDLWREGDLQLIQGGDDRGHCKCGHGLPDVIKDIRHPHDHVGRCPFSHPPTVCRRRSATAQRDFSWALTTTQANYDACGRTGTSHWPDPPKRDVPAAAQRLPAHTVRADELHRARSAQQLLASAAVTDYILGPLVLFAQT